MAADVARDRFLKEAAHLLAITSPTTSATLGAARDSLLQAQDADIEAEPKEWHVIRREACGACGNTMAPGWSCEVTLGNQSTDASKARKDGMLKDWKRRKGTAKERDRKEKGMVYTCLRCNRKTVQPLQSRARRQSRVAYRGLIANKPTSVLAKADQEDKSKDARSANASSKQRAKARKGGLQAMLAQSKTQNNAKQGLDLMDFMA